MTADELATLSERAARIIAGGGGLLAIALALAEAADGAVLIEDDQWRHLALAERKGGVGPLPPSFSSFYLAAGRRSPNGTVVRSTISGSLHALCVQMPAPSDADTGAGYVTLFLRDKSRADLAPALRIAASAAAVEYARRGAGRGQARRLFWEQYLGGEMADLGGLKAQAQAAGVVLPPSFLAGVFDLEGATAQNCRDVVVQALTPADAVCPLAGTGSQVVVLFPIRHKVDIARARQAASNAVRDLPEAGAAKSVNCGIGSFHADLLELPPTLSEARLALSLGRRLFGRGAVAVYPDLGIYALLHAGADRDALAAFAESVIEPLQTYDRKHKTELLATLHLYFEVGENVKEAAERLSVHRHTIFYRLNQISQILKTDLKTPKGQLSLRAALAIRQMNAHEESHE